MADLQDAIDEFRSENVSDLRAGEEDGTISFDYITNDEAYEATTIQAIVAGMTAILKHTT